MFRLISADKNIFGWRYENKFVGHISHHQRCWACPVSPSWARAIMPKPVSLGTGSTLKPTFISNGLRLSHSSSAYLGSDNMPRLIFTSDRLGYLAQAQHSPENFFSSPTRVPRYFILIQYVLFWLEYNSKYHKGEIILQSLLSTKG
jgi:hypothetical protein